MVGRESVEPSHLIPEAMMQTSSSTNCMLSPNSPNREDQMTGVAGAVVSGAVQDTKQYVQDLHTSTTCDVGGCSAPH